MASFYCMLGLPGSGKSYQAKKIVENKKALLYSSDEFRIKLNKDPSIDQENNDLFDLMYDEIRQKLIEGFDVVLDATNTYEIYRKKLFASLKNCNARIVCVFVLRTYENCLEANHKRKEKIDDSVIEMMYKDFDVPYFHEPWDEINLIYTDEDCHVFAKEDNVVAFAGRLISFFEETGKNKTGHERSYDALFYTNGSDDGNFALHVSFLINHMHLPLLWQKNSEQMNTDLDRFGQDLFSELKLLYKMF